MRVLCPLAWLLGRRILLAGLDDPTHQTQSDDDQSARDNPALRQSQTRCGISQAGNDQERANEVDNHVRHELPPPTEVARALPARRRSQIAQDEVALFQAVIVACLKLLYEGGALRAEVQRRLDLWTRSIHARSRYNGSNPRTRLCWSRRATERVSRRRPGTESAAWGVKTVILWPDS
jgi:hypothetical protein